MPLTTAQMRAHIFLVILEKFSSSAERRREAVGLRDIWRGFAGYLAR